MAMNAMLGILKGDPGVPGVTMSDVMQADENLMLEPHKLHEPQAYRSPFRVPADARVTSADR